MGSQAGAAAAAASSGRATLDCLRSRYGVREPVAAGLPWVTHNSTVLYLFDSQNPTKMPKIRKKVREAIGCRPHHSQLPSADGPSTSSKTADFEAWRHSHCTSDAEGRLCRDGCYQVLDDRD